MTKGTAAAAIMVAAAIPPIAATATMTVFYRRTARRLVGMPTNLTETLHGAWCDDSAPCLNCQ